MDDLLLAQKIICNKFCNINSDIYHENSFVYLFTNEKIKLYQEFMKNRKNSLSIISSGDQVLNLCLECSNIDCFDISRFPKYLLELKKALISSLNYDDYIEFFFNSIHYNNEKYDDFIMNQGLIWIRNIEIFGMDYLIILIGQKYVILLYFHLKLFL